MLRSVKSLFVVPASFALLMALDADAQVISELQPAISLGGATRALSVDPGNALHVLAATERGGIFRSEDAGYHWSHVDSFATDRAVDVAFSPSTANVVVATSLPDSGSGHSSGIWRSDDGGEHWLPVSITLAPDNTCSERSAGWGISWVAGSNTVWVAHDCGLLRSDDNGQYWTRTIPDPSSPSRMFSVLALSSSHIVASGPGGLYVMQDDGIWQRAVGSLTNNGCRRAFALASNNLLLYDCFGTSLNVSTDGGSSWRPFPVSLPDRSNQPPFVRATSSALGGSFFEVWLSDGVSLKHASLSVDPASWPSSVWQDAPVDHVDVHDMVFDPSGRPLLAACDGGVMGTVDGGGHWVMRGAGPGGLNALEVFGVAVQDLPSQPSPAALYFITWHNGTWASLDGGRTWRIAPAVSEGKRMYASGPLLRSTEEGIVSVLAYSVYPHPFTFGMERNADSYRRPRDQNCQGMLLFFKDLDGAPYALSNCPYMTGIYDRRRVQDGAGWQELFSAPGVPLYGHPQPAASSAGINMYQAMRGPNGITLTKFNGIDGPLGGVIRSDPPMAGFGSMTTDDFMDSEPVFAVRPDDDRVLIAADARDSRMKISTDSGQSWQSEPLAQLTDLILMNGVLPWALGNESQVTAIAYDPYDPGRVVVGTRRSGVLYSVDGGIRWGRVPGSLRATNVSAFAFDRNANVYIATVGRSVWKWRSPTVSHYPYQLVRYLEQSLKSAIVNDVRFDPSTCPVCAWIVARAGELTSLRLDQKDGQWSASASSPRMTLLYAPNGTLPNVDEGKQGSTPVFDGCPACAKAVASGGSVRAVLVEGGKVRAFAVSPAGTKWSVPDDTAFADELAPRLTPGISISGAGNATGVAVAQNGDGITITGSGFHDNPESVITITIGGLPVAKVAPKKGAFDQAVTLAMPPAETEVKATQQVLDTMFTASVPLIVLNRDGEGKN